MTSSGNDSIPYQPTLRVVQLDAAELDAEILRSLREQVAKALQFFGPSFLARFEPEMNALLRGAVWWFSVYLSDATFGQSMLSIAYRQGSSPGRSSSLKSLGKLLHFSIIVVAQWIAERSSWLQHLATQAIMPGDSAQIVRLITRCSALLKVANLINFIVFLQQGHYQTLIERLLGWRTVFTRHGLNQQIDFDIQNRELLWHTCGEFLLFLAPVVHARWVTNILGMLSLPWRQSGPGGSTSVSVTSSEMTADTRCTVCKQLPTSPHAADCGHVFCYYCIKANHMADDGYRCPACSAAVSSVVPVTPTQS